MVSAQLEGKRLERYEDAEEAEGMGNKSEFLRSVVEDGLDAREQTAYQAAGLSDRLAAQLEDEREFYDDEADILLEVVEDGLTARRGDALDAIGADDELRAAVEDAREDGEPLDDTVRRLLRDSAEDGDSAAGRQPSTVVPATLPARALSASRSRSCRQSASAAGGSPASPAGGRGSPIRSPCYRRGFKI